MSVSLHKSELLALRLSEVSSDRQESEEASNQQKPTQTNELPQDVFTFVSKSQENSHVRSANHFGRSHEYEFDVYVLEKIQVLDTAEERVKYREKIRQSLSFLPETEKSKTYLQIMKERLAVAEKYDLLLLESGNLYHQGKLIQAYQINGQGILIVQGASGQEWEILPAVDQEEIYQENVFSEVVPQNLLNFSHQVYVNGDQPLSFAYNDFENGAAIFVKSPLGETFRFASAYEISESLKGLFVLPENYLDEIEFLDVFKWNEMKLPKSKIDLYDLEESGDEELVPRAFQAVAVAAYQFKIQGKTIEIRIPVLNEKQVSFVRRNKLYSFSGDDTLQILKIMTHLIPFAFLPNHLKVTIMPCQLKDDVFAYVSESDHVVFSNLKTESFEEWTKTIFLSAIQHEMAHVFHDDNRMLRSLIYRCMLLDGFSMEYGNSNLDEYFAVLTENFFDHPERRFLFPHGYRLLYTLIKLRENGARWSDDQAGKRLLELATGLKPSGSEVVTKSNRQKKTKRKAFSLPQAPLMRNPLSSLTPSLSSQKNPGFQSVKTILPSTKSLLDFAKPQINFSSFRQFSPLPVFVR